MRDSGRWRAGVSSTVSTNETKFSFSQGSPSIGRRWEKKPMHDLAYKYRVVHGAVRKMSRGRG